MAHLDNNEKIELGHQAQTFLDNPAVASCFDLLERRYIEAWRASNSIEKREDAWRYVRMLEWFKSDLRSIALTGDLTQTRIDELQGRPIQLSEFRR